MIDLSSVHAVIVDAVDLLCEGSVAGFVSSDIDFASLATPLTEAVEVVYGLG